MTQLVTLDDLSSAQLETLLDRASALEQQPITNTLAGCTVALLFLNPSLRTLASMQAGVSQLGGSSFVIQPGAGTWNLETRPGVVMDGDKAEHIREAIPVLAQYADLLAMRCFAEGKDLAADLEDGLIRNAAELTGKPFINLESAVAHPCQALADWKTLEDLRIPRQGGRFVLSWAWHPRALPLAVPISALRMAARRGMEVTVLRPESFTLPTSVMESARALAAEAGGNVRETDNRQEAMEGAHVLYAKSWGAPSAYGNAEQEMALRQELRGWCVDEPWFDGAETGAHFMHCLPVRRNVVVADSILDGPRSVVVQQAGNRLHAQKALLELLLGG